MSSSKRKADEALSSDGAANLDAELDAFLAEISDLTPDLESNANEATTTMSATTTTTTKTIATATAKASIGPSIGPSIPPPSGPKVLITREVARAEPVKKYNPDEPTEEEKKADGDAPLPLFVVPKVELRPTVDEKTVDKDKDRRVMRHAAGQTWKDETLVDWPEGDFRIFCGDLGNDVTDDTLLLAFKKYSSVAKARIVRDKRTMKSKGYGFVSFLDPHDFIKALKEMNGKYCGNRPMKLRKSTWDDREFDKRKGKK
eukprot:TRINITY_DN437_c0_g2_i1.p1 TRINITY_DN437_c0_g2~~TRINITY_DN437_c0_g2_i1.p1  ORF type:complete len:258 (+),score=67.04 TRINITY_DN437_c0_g2_i1:89-862(+)